MSTKTSAKTPARPGDRTFERYDCKVWTIDEVAFEKKAELEKRFNDEVVKHKDCKDKLTKQEFVGGNPKFTYAFGAIEADKRIGFATFWEHYRRYYFPNFRREELLRKRFQEWDVDNSKMFDVDELNKVLSDNEFSKAEKEMIKAMTKKLSKTNQMKVEDFIEAWREVVRTQIEEQKKKYIK